MKTIICLSSLALLILTSCGFQKIETDATLNESTKSLIRSLGLLDKNEKIIKYYSNFEKNKAGNFFTDRRIAHYWIDVNNPSETDTSFSFYENILSIDTFYEVPDTFVPYMTIKKKDSTTFKVFIDGTEREKKDFFEEAIKTWKSHSRK